MEEQYISENKSTEEEINKLKLEYSLSRSDIEKEIKRLKGNKIKVHDIPTKKTIDILDRCAKLWLDRDYSNKHIRVLSKLTNQSFELVAYELEGVIQMLLKENIEKTITEELGNIEIMDKWIDTSYGKEHRQPRGLVFHNVSGNAFVVIVMSIAMGLLSKNCNLVKVSKDEPYFAYAFYKSLCEIDESIKDRLSIVYFQSSDAKMYETIVKNSDCVVHWGGEHSLDFMKDLCAKYNAHLISHGAKVSFEVIDETNDLLETSKAVSKDIVLWEQKACLSPRIVFVNKDIDIVDFGKKIAQSLKILDKKLPKAYLSPWNSVKTIQDRQYCILKYGIGKDEKIKVYSSFNSDYTVILSKKLPDKEDLDRCFYRFIFVCPYSDKNEVYEYVNKNLKKYLQTMGYSGNDRNFIEKMTLLGLSIVTKPGDMSMHYPGTSHDGISNLNEMTYLVSSQICTDNVTA
ncbi:MAG: acyl-CoA reductase [Clostridium sp.]|nr:acyl-CoA reductase [Clostridium sp.]